MRNLLIALSLLFATTAVSAQSLSKTADDIFRAGGNPGLSQRNFRNADSTKLNTLPNLSTDLYSTTLVAAGKNLADPNQFKHFAYLDNTLFEASNSQYFYTDWMPVTPTKVYTGWDGTLGMRFVTYFDSLRNFVTGGISSATTSFTCPSGVYWVIVSGYESGRNTFQFEQASSATTFEQFKGYTQFSTGVSTTAAIPSVTYRKYAGKNLFDYTKASIDSTLDNTGVRIFSRGLYSISDFMPVLAFRRYTGWDGVSNMRYTCFYAADKKTVVPGGSSTTVTSFTAPAGAFYVRVTYNTTRREALQFEWSPFATQYASFQSSQPILTQVGSATVTALPADEYRVTLRDIERLVWFHNSYGDAVYQLKGKGYLSMLSMHTDWNIENFSQSGDTYQAMLARIQNNTRSFHSYAGINDIGTGGYAFIGEYTNDLGAGIINSTNQLNTYLTNMKSVADAVRAKGFKPFIFSDYTVAGDTYGYLYSAAVSEFCNRSGYTYVDVAQKAALLKGSPINPKYWYGSHPGVRANTIFWSPFLPYIQALPRPRRSIKVYTKRASYTMSGITDFLYADVSSRNKMFRELPVSQHALPSANEKYYDDLTTLSSNTALNGSSTQLINPYMQLLFRDNFTSSTVNVADYAMVECVLNANAGNVKSMGLYVNTQAPIAVWVRDWVNNSWTRLGSTTKPDGSKIFYLTDPKLQIYYDKATFLLFNSSSWQIGDLYYVWSGTEGKDMQQRVLPVDLSSAESLTTTTFSTTNVSGWTVTGTVSASAADATPQSASLVATVDQSNYVSQVVSFSPETVRNRKCQITVIARRNPPAYSSSNTYPTNSLITDDTYDLASLGIDLTYNSNNIVSFSRNVGLHWTEGFVEFLLPPNITSVTLTLKSRDVALELAKASVKVEP